MIKNDYQSDALGIYLFDPDFDFDSSLNIMKPDV